MARFFVTKEAVSDGSIVISGSDAHHIARSLRMAVGDKLVVCSNGIQYSCHLTKIRDEECLCEIDEQIDLVTESPVDITLCMAYPKGDKLEVVIQKAVELGVNRIIPFESSRCIKRPKADKAEKQTARFRKISEEAAKQCGRAKIPTIEQPMSYSQMLNEATKSDLALFCYEHEEQLSIKKALANRRMPESISVIIGAEGGFSSDEWQLAQEKGCISISLGNRIMRCETAPSYILSAISYEYEL